MSISTNIKQYNHDASVVLETPMWGTCGVACIYKK